MYIVRILDLHKIISSEKAPLKYLCNKLNVQCPECSSRNYYVLAKGSLRCSECRSDYTPSNNTYFTTIAIPLYKWLALIKLFELSVSARKASIEADVSYPTA